MPSKLLELNHPLYFMRHGETDWNAEGRFQGQTDIPINHNGKNQAKTNGTRLISVQPDLGDWHFLASPMGRTRETMELARAAMALAPMAYQTDQRLIEVSFGDWERNTIDELSANQQVQVEIRTKDKWNYVPPNGESYDQLAQRVKPVFESLTGPTMLVSHGGVMRALFYLLGHLSGDEAALADTPQDKVLFVKNNAISWV